MKKGNKQKGAISTLLIAAGLLIVMYFLALYLSDYVRDYPTLDDQNSDDNETVVRDIDFVTLSQGAYSDYSEEGAVLIDNKSDYETLTRQVSAGRFPEVDFDINLVIAVFLGEKPTGGYSISVESILNEGELTTVNIDKVTPGRNCIVTEAIVMPYHIIQFERVEGQIEFISNNVTEDC